eukprot:Lankesteria_metandrocarpae@DN6614_c0_g1_i1.p1
MHPSAAVYLGQLEMVYRNYRLTSIVRAKCMVSDLERVQQNLLASDNAELRMLVAGSFPEFLNKLCPGVGSEVATFYIAADMAEKEPHLCMTTAPDAVLQKHFLVIIALSTSTWLATADDTTRANFADEKLFWIKSGTTLRAHEVAQIVKTTTTLIQQHTGRGRVLCK